jgi:peptidoglycan/LPS O-acetylase OafA/YrhL
LFCLLIIISLTFLELPIDSVTTIIVAFLFALIMFFNLQESNAASFAFLNNNFIKYIGILSYSMYIWQQPFTYSLTFVRKMSAFQPYKGNLAYFLVSLGSLIAVIIVSYCSYFFFEKKLLKFKDKF